MPWKIINGKEYWVHESEGSSVIFGDPMKDQAEAFANELNKNKETEADKINREYQRYCENHPEPTLMLEPIERKPEVMTALEYYGSIEDCRINRVNPYSKVNEHGEKLINGMTLDELREHCEKHAEERAPKPGYIIKNIIAWSIIIIFSILSWIWLLK